MMMISKFEYDGVSLLFLHILYRLNHNGDTNSINQSEEQIDKNKSTTNSQSIRKPLADRTNSNNKRCLRSSGKQTDDDEETNSDLISSIKPKPKRRRRWLASLYLLRPVRLP